MATVLKRTDIDALMNPQQLAQEVLDATGLNVVVEIDQEDVTFTVLGDLPDNKVSNVQKVLDDYEFDPDWNRPEVKRLKELQEKEVLTTEEANEAVLMLLKGTTL